jgi:hypothetical protein
MARDRATILKELLKSENTISTLTQRLAIEELLFRALSAELQSEIPASDRPSVLVEATRRRTPGLQFCSYRPWRAKNTK